MKIQCEYCETMEADVLCCADEAALCWICDELIHSANKLASRHKRVLLSPSSSMPKCDVCQEARGFFFCLEDRALLCLNCDATRNLASSSMSHYQRYLITGVNVGIETIGSCLSSTTCMSSLDEVSRSTASQSMCRNPNPFACANNDVFSGHSSAIGLSITNNSLEFQDGKYLDLPCSVQNEEVQGSGSLQPYERYHV